jgi:hypothetical protein
MLLLRKKKKFPKDHNALLLNKLLRTGAKNVLSKEEWASLDTKPLYQQKCYKLKVFSLT